jgi:hypothetical protein
LQGKALVDIKFRKFSEFKRGVIYGLQKMDTHLKADTKEIGQQNGRKQMIFFMIIYI